MIETSVKFHRLVLFHKLFQNKILLVWWCLLIDDDAGVTNGAAVGASLPNLRAFLDSRPPLLFS